MFEEVNMVPAERNQCILGMILIFMGVFLMFFYPFNYGTAMGAALLALAMGIYFSGINVVINCRIKRDPKLQEISDKIDAFQKRLDELK